MEIIDKYIFDHSSKEDAILKELDRATHLHVIQPRMLSGHIQGKFLEMVVRMLNPTNILEIGTFTGYSALCMAAGLNENGHIDTFEVDDELEGIARSFFDKSIHKDKITLHIGSVLNAIDDISKEYDFVFIDGDKREYPDYLRMIMGDNGGSAKVKSGSYIIADNILWYGKVLGNVPSNDRHTIAIQTFNDMVVADNRLENVILPIRDGINLIRVK